MFTVDAFSKHLFQGNTCAVCILDDWFPDIMLQNIASQNLFSETAFIVQRDGMNPELRWFTVSEEVDFCGYGTLSAGAVYLTHVKPTAPEVIFETRKFGSVRAFRQGEVFQFEVSATPLAPMTSDTKVLAALPGASPQKMFQSQQGNLVIVYDREKDVAHMKPHFEDLMANGYYGYILTSPGQETDYTFRYFSPRKTNVWEDPVNGSSHAFLAPYWSDVLEKTSLKAQSASLRGGEVYATLKENGQVQIGGYVTLYAESLLHLPTLN